MNWPLIALMALAPLPAALLIAWPIWRTGQPILGNLTGTVVIFSAALGLILRESVEIERVTRACVDAGYTCWPDPAAFTRYAIYATIGLFEVFALFTISLTVEARMRRRDYSPEWR